jgi:hypothetical protein
VKPETVIGWHRAGFRLYWRWLSRARSGRPKVTVEIRELIRRLAQENVDWGAPKIHAELLKLGFQVSERTVARYLTQWGGVATQGSGGRHFSRTIVKSSSLSTFSPCRHRRSSCSIASS